MEFLYKLVQAVNNGNLYKSLLILKKVTLLNSRPCKCHTKFHSRRQIEREKDPYQKFYTFRITRRSPYSTGFFSQFNFSGFTCFSNLAQNLHNFIKLHSSHC